VPSGEKTKHVPRSVTLAEGSVVAAFDGPANAAADARAATAEVPGKAAAKASTGGPCA
jgi:hypothetical protein